MRFDELKVGDKFLFGHNGVLCMKVEIDRHISDRPGVNFIYLASGQLSMSDDDILVTPVQLTFVPTVWEARPQEPNTCPTCGRDK